MERPSPSDSPKVIQPGVGEGGGTEPREEPRDPRASLPQLTGSCVWCCWPKGETLDATAVRPLHSFKQETEVTVGREAFLWLLGPLCTPA